MRDWFERLAASRPRGVLAHSRLDDGQRGFEIHYEPQPRDAVPLAAAIERWRADPPASIPGDPRARPLRPRGRRRAGRPRVRRRARGPHDHPRSSPARPAPGGSSRCRPGGMSLADWARAEPDTWLWSTREDGPRRRGARPRAPARGGPAPRDGRAARPRGAAGPREVSPACSGAASGLPARLAAAIRTALAPLARGGRRRAGTAGPRLPRTDPPRRDPARPRPGSGWRRSPRSSRPSD